MNPSSKKTADDAIISNIEKKNYHVAIVLLEQLQHEHMKLSKENQVRLCECLIHVGRVLDALPYIQQFIERGNNLRSLQFLFGVAYFKMNEFQSAKDIFDHYPEWRRWSDKCKLMLDMPKDKSRTIFIGEFPKQQNLNDPKNPIKPEVIQDAKNILFKFPIKCVLPSNVEIVALPYSLDITIKYENDEYKRSFELSEQILPKTVCKNITYDSVEIMLDKAKPAIWQIIEKSPEDIIQESDITIEKVVQALDGLPNYTDQEASEMFEQSHNFIMGNSGKNNK